MSRRRVDTGPDLFGGPASAEDDERAPRVVAGVDEAGLGPLLGPLTIGWSALRFLRDPPRAAARAPWPALSPLVREDPRELGAPGARLCVTDSKRVFDRSATGHRRLEASALAFLNRARGTPLAHGLELCASGPPGLRTDATVLERHPWYEYLGALPRWIGEEELHALEDALGCALGEAELELADAGVRVLPAGELNDSFERTGNKAATVWEHCSRILAHLFDAHGAAGLELHLDRQGGRRHYEEPLRALFPRARVRTLAKDAESAEYRIEEDARWMHVVIRTRGEEHSFCTALASCFAKYARELAMAGFNDYFGEAQHGLKPTAGYVTDGRRWLREAAPALAERGVPPRALVRER